VFAAVGAWILLQAGWLASWDGVFYDRLLSWTAQWRESQPKVLLLRLPGEESWSDKEAIQTIETLDKLGARIIAVNFVPRDNSREFFQRVAQIKKVVFGRKLRPDPKDPDIVQPDIWPEAARGLNLEWGAVCLPPGESGVYRSQQVSVVSGTETYPTFEARTVALWEPASTTLPMTGSCLINFVGGPGTLPNVSLSRVLAGDLIAEMVRDRVVLIGTTDSLLGLRTPVCSGSEAMSFLEFQANAVQTLLDRTPIRTLSWPGTLVLLTGLGVISSLLYQRAKAVAGARLAFGILLASTLIALAALWFVRLWLPLGAVVLAQVGQFALILLFKTRMTNRALNEMRLHSVNQLKERFCAANVAVSPDYWDQVTTMINQTLDVRRMVFFERVPRTQRLAGIKAVNCRWEDLGQKETRLDAPFFAKALSKSEPVRASGFFAQDPAPEEEYLCPLTYSGELLGLWVIGIDPASAASIPDFEAVLSRFSRQLARLLFQQRQVAPERSFSTRLRDWFSAEKEDQAYRDLRSTVDVLEQYYDVIESVMSQVGTAMIAYDFFGRVLKANDPAVALLRAENFLPDRATALEFLSLVTGLDAPELKSLLRNLLLDRSPASMSVKFASQGDRRFLLRVYPLTEIRAGRSGSDPFSVRGIVCEIIETTSLSTLASLKGVVADRLSVELRDHLAAVEISATLLETEDLPAAKRKSILEAIHEKTRICIQVISECQNYLGRSVDAFAIDCFPVDAIEVLNRTCSTLSQKAAARGVTIEMERPRLMAQVLASSAELSQLFSSVLELLVKDAAEQTPLSIKVEDASTTAVFRFANRGFGIPNDRLQAIFANPEPSASEELQLLRKAIVWVRNWGGNLEVASDVGKGYTVTLSLKQFNFTPLLPAQRG
jgi:CHASE2 domain-containing sensor protein/signal transduction histidine kinase